MLKRFHTLLVLAILAPISSARAASNSTWSGFVSDPKGKPLTGAMVVLHSASATRDYTATSTQEGRFAFAAIEAGSYELAVRVKNQEWKAGTPFMVKEASASAKAISRPGERGVANALIGQIVRQLAAVISVQICWHQGSSTPITAVSPQLWLWKMRRLAAT